MPFSLHQRIMLLALLVLLPALQATQADADEWNQVFAQPKYFLVARSVHLRSAPSNNSRILITLKPGTPLEGSGIEEGWHKVRTADGKNGYVFKRFLRSDPSAASAFSGAEAPVPSGDPVAAEPRPDVRPEPVPAEEPLVSPEPAPEAPVQEAPAEDPVVQSAPEVLAVPAEEPVVEAEPIAEPPAPAEEPEPLSSVTPTTTEGADCKRIKFQPGAISGSLDRTLEAMSTHCYQLEAASNQWLEVWLSSADSKATFQIFSPAGASVTAGEAHWLGRTEADGDYIIIVTALDGSAASYNLKIQLK